MSPLKIPPAIVRFGTFEVDLASREIRKQGLRIRLEEKPFQILELLLEAPGQLVSRDTLREKLWPSTYVGYEHSLNTAVNKLREQLGDSAQSPRFVETIPRRGYRFIAPVDKPVNSAPAGRVMLAVLPFENLSSNSGQEFFAEGLTEEIISHLGQLNPKRLGVIARTSAVQYKGSAKTIGDIAEELRVGYVLEGSIRQEGQRVRITAQLIEAEFQTHVWSSNYDRTLDDILSLQEDVSREVSKALALALLPETASDEADRLQETSSRPAISPRMR